MDIASLLGMPETWTALTSPLRSALLLTVIGLASLAIVRNYRDDPKTAHYKWSVLVGMGVALLAVAYTALQYMVGTWSHAMIVFVGMTCFALLFRPLIARNIALGIVTLEAVVSYFAMAIFVPGAFGLIGVDGVVLLVVMVATLFYHMLHFAEAGMELVAGILNAWPILAVLGLVCIVEAVLIVMGMPFLSS